MNLLYVRVLACLAVSCFSGRSATVSLNASFGTGFAFQSNSGTPFATVMGLFLSTPIGPELAGEIAANPFDPIVTAQIGNFATLSDFQFLAQPPQNLDAGQSLFNFISHPCANCQGQVFDSGPEFIGTVNYPLTSRMGPGGITVSGSANISYYTRVFTVITPNAPTIPEPGTWLPTGLGLFACFCGAIRRRITQIHSTLENGS